MLKVKGLTIPCYICFTFIHLGFHIYKNSNDMLHSDECTDNNTEGELTKPFTLPFSPDLAILDIEQIGEDEFEASTVRFERGMY